MSTIYLVDILYFHGEKDLICDEYKHFGVTSINNRAPKYEKHDEQKPYSALDTKLQTLCMMWCQNK